jgi:hypothetical protein
MRVFPLECLVERALDELGAEGWRTGVDETWYRVTPPDVPQREQGWKLHLSATRLSAPEVLHRAAHVLIAAGCGFKFAKSLDLAAEMSSARYDRAQAGKFLTAYPRDDEQLRTLARDLDEATLGLPGPAVLSDRPFRKGGLVHYRYGAFSGVPVLTDDGVLESRLQVPGGGTTPDVREPWFCPPPWAQPPFGPEPVRPAAPAAGPVLLAGRFEVREAIQHSARGGVYRARDQRTGTEVIIKQARAHIGGGLAGEDAREALRREERALERLPGICPLVVTRFEEDGHLFLVQELVPGVPLAQWAQDRHGEPQEHGGMTAERAVAMARRLVGVLRQVHERGLVYQDFSPNNVMVTPEDELVLIDPEWLTEPGTWTSRAYTPGFGAPEQLAEPRLGPAHGDGVDRYALGAVLFFLTTGVVPVFAEEIPADRDVLERLEPMWPLLYAERPAARVLEPAVRGLLHRDPERRWPLERVGAFLDSASLPPATAAPRPSVPSVPSAPRALAPQARRRLVDDGLTHLIRTMTGPEDGDGPAGGGDEAAARNHRLWPSARFGARTDPCNVQHGAAGLLATFTLATALLGGLELRAATERTAAWIDARREAVPRLLPGLYFGRSGTAWALYDAARLLADERLAAHALDLARAVPVVWPNPDICHGAAGAGLAQLHLWRATGRQEFLDRADTCAAGLVAAARHEGDRVLWPVPESMDSNLAGIRYLGFAHGVAGVGAFLLAAGEATGGERYTELAAAAGRTLAAEAELGPWGARWRADIRDKHGETMLYHWCSGASGVGTFLLRLARRTGDAASLRLAEQAASAVRWAAWQSPTAACHGLAGNGQFLLDLAAERPDGPYRQWAQELALVLHARHVRREGLWLLPDESGKGFTADSQTGTGGVLDFLLRLEHGGPRPWMADPPGRLQEAARPSRRRSTESGELTEPKGRLR